MKQDSIFVILTYRSQILLLYVVSNIYVWSLRAYIGLLKSRNGRNHSVFRSRNFYFFHVVQEGKQMTVPVGQEDEEVSDDEPEDLMLDEEEDEEHQFHHGGK